MPRAFKKGDRVRVISNEEFEKSERYYTHRELAGRTCTILDPEDGEWLVTDIPYDVKQKRPYARYERENYWKVLVQHIRLVDTQMFLQFPKGHV